eukprot:scaffold303795_cov32-Tisochrysis_lutea.AAC.3
MRIVWDPQYFQHYAAQSAKATATTNLAINVRTSGEVTSTSTSLLRRSAPTRPLLLSSLGLPTEEGSHPPTGSNRCVAVGARGRRALRDPPPSDVVTRWSEMEIETDGRA